MSRHVFNDVSEYLNDIISLLGDVNEEIDETLIEDIFEEIESIEEEDMFDLSVISIKLGKAGILEFILSDIVLSKEQIEFLSYLIDTHFDKYKNDLITKRFKQIIKKYKRKNIGKRKT